MIHNNDGGFRHEKTRAVGDVGFILGDPVGIRTPNLLIRSEVLYPVELQGLVEQDQ